MEFNGFTLTGEVFGGGESKLIVRTIGRGATGNTFEDDHVVTVDGAAELAEKLTGKRVSVIGQIVTTAGKEPKLLATKVEKATKGAPDVNLANVIGEVVSFDFFPPAEGKRQFGNLLVRAAENLVSGVAFRGLASELKRKAKPGAIVEMWGRLRRRAFERANGGSGHAIDVIVDSRTEIRKTAEMNDPFAAQKKAMAEAQAAEAGKTERKASGKKAV